MQVFGGIEPVELTHCDELIDPLDSEPDSVDLVAFLTRRLAPLVLCNTEGDPLVFCEASLTAPTRPRWPRHSMTSGPSPHVRPPS